MSFPGRILSATNVFRPALDYLSYPWVDTPQTPRIQHCEPDDTDSSPSLHTDSLSPGLSGSGFSTLRPWHSRESSGDIDPLGSGIPLIDYSRTPSPNPYGGLRSVTHSEDEDEGVPVTLRPLVTEDYTGRGRGFWRKLTKSENLGGFLFGTWLGWQVYVALLVVWSFAVGFCLVLMNRFILWTGTYKFPYPLAAVWIQLAFTHGFLILAACLTRLFASPLRSWGLNAFIAPEYPLMVNLDDIRPKGRLQRLNPLYILFSNTGGIAGGGLLQFDRSTAWVVTPLAIVYVGKAVLSSISYAYAALPLYTLSRIPTVPVILVATAFLTRTTHSISTLSGALIVTLNLLIASIRRSERLIWESIVAGIFSTLFVALYPILLLRTQRKLAAREAHADVLFDRSHPRSTAEGQTTREETRAYWTLLHYTSLLSLFFLSLLLLVSGEVPNILHNCYFLDVPWFWFLTFMGGLANFAVFSTNLAFVRATSPLTTEFLKLPRQAAQMMVLERFKLPVHAWVGVSLVYVGSLYFVWVRRDEGRKWEMKRIGMARR